jgi:hypothetical protein
MRRMGAGVAGIAGISVLVADVHGSDRGKLLLPIGALVAAALLIHLRGLGPQLVARAAYWANLGLGTIVCVLGGSHERTSGVALAAGCGAALLLVGRHGIGEAGERAGYAPSAFRSSLLLLMVLALADAQTFFLFSLLEWDDGKLGSSDAGVMLFGAGVLLVIGFVGLYRLAIWGALLNVATCACVLLLTLSRGVRLDSDFRPVVAILTSLQLVVAAPMMVSLVLRRPLFREPPPALRGLIANAAVLVLLAVCGWAFLRR